MSSPSEQMSKARSVVEVEASGAAVEAIGGIGVIVLSILALGGVAPNFLAAIAGIIFGVAIFAHGTAVAAEYSKLLSQVAEDRTGSLELGGGMTSEFLSGIAIIVLGILSLIGKSPTILMPALIIVAGVALALSAGAIQRLNDLRIEATASSDFGRRVAKAAVSGAAGAQLLAGVATIVLGILAFAFGPQAATAVQAGTAQHPLTLVGLLVVGSAITLSGSLLTGRLMRLLNHR